MEKIKKYFERDEFARFCDIELTEVGPGQASARVTVQQKHLNGVEITHGGLLFTLADFAFAAASNSHGKLSLGINANISIYQATRKGDTLVARAFENSLNPKLGGYTVEIKNQDGELIALFQGLVYRKSQGLPE